MAGKQRAFLIAQATASAAYIALLVSMAYASVCRAPPSLIYLGNV